MTFLVPALSLIAFLAPAQHGAPMPKRIFAGAAAQRVQPIWVSASVALDQHGKPATELDAAAKALLTASLETPVQDGCIREGQTIFDPVADNRDRSSLESTVNSATLVFEGRISGIEPGFFGGVAGQLYRVDVEKTLKGPNNRGFYYFFLQVGRIPVGKEYICKTSRLFPTPPQFNNHVVVSTNSFGGSDRELIEIYEPEDLIIENADGTAAIASTLTDTEPQLSGATFSDVVLRVQARLASSKGVAQ